MGDLKLPFGCLAACMSYLDSHQIKTFLSLPFESSYAFKYLCLNPSNTDNASSLLYYQKRPRGHYQIFFDIRISLFVRTSIESEVIWVLCNEDNDFKELSMHEGGTAMKRSHLSNSSTIAPHVRRMV